MWTSVMTCLSDVSGSSVWVKAAMHSAGSVPTMTSQTVTRGIGEVYLSTVFILTAASTVSLLAASASLLLVTGPEWTPLLCAFTSSVGKQASTLISSSLMTQMLSLWPSRLELTSSWSSGGDFFSLGGHSDLYHETMWLLIRIHFALILSAFSLLLCTCWPYCCLKYQYDIFENSSMQDALVLMDRQVLKMYRSSTRLCKLNILFPHCLTGKEVVQDSSRTTPINIGNVNQHAPTWGADDSKQRRCCHVNRVVGGGRNSMW